MLRINLLLNYGFNSSLTGFFQPLASRSNTLISILSLCVCSITCSLFTGPLSVNAYTFCASISFSVDNGNLESASAFPNLLPFLYSMRYEYIAKKIAHLCNRPAAIGMLFCSLKISFNGWWSRKMTNCFPKYVFVDFFYGKHYRQRYSMQLRIVFLRLSESTTGEQNRFVYAVNYM